MPPTLYTTLRLGKGSQALAVFRELELDVRIEEVDVHRGEGQRAEYSSRTSLGKIPALEDGGLLLTESNAILLHCAEQYGDARLFSAHARVRAEIVRWMFWEASQWQPCLVPVLGGCVAQRLGLAPPTPPAQPAWDDGPFRRQARSLDAHLAGRSFLVGDALTIADLCVAGMMTYARVAKFPFDDHANIAAWYERVEAMKASRATEIELWRA